MSLMVSVSVLKAIDGYEMSVVESHVFSGLSGLKFSEFTESTWLNSVYSVGLRIPSVMYRLFGSRSE